MKKWDGTYDGMIFLFYCKGESSRSQILELFHQNRVLCLQWLKKFWKHHSRWYQQKSCRKRRHQIPLKGTPVERNSLESCLKPCNGWGCHDSIKNHDNKDAKDKKTAPKNMNKHKQWTFFFWKMALTVIEIIVLNDRNDETLMYINW